MSKELTPLEALEELRYRITNFNGKFHNYIELMGTIETALKEYELMKQTKIIVADKKITGNDLEKLKNQRMFVSSLEESKVEPLFDEKTQKNLKALEIIKKRKLVLYDEMSKSICTKGYIHDIPQEECDLLKEVGL